MQEFIPKVEKIVPSYALVLNDFAVTAAPIVMRCSFSKQLLSVPHKDAVILSCGNILSSQSFKLLKQKGSLTPFQEPGDIVVRCPFCVRSVRADGRMHWVKCDKLGIISDFYSYYHMDQEYDDEEARPTPKDFHGLKWFKEIESSRSFLDRKFTKGEAIMRWAASQGDAEDENATSERRNKRSRGDSSGPPQNDGLFVRVLNQCSEIED